MVIDGKADGKRNNHKPQQEEGFKMLEIKDKKILINDQCIPKGDINILKYLLKEKIATVFRLMELAGKISRKRLI